MPLSELIEPSVHNYYEISFSFFFPDDETYERMEEHKASLVWKPLEGLSQEDEDTIDGFLELACSPAIPHGGRNKELALHILHQVKGSVKVKRSQPNVVN